MITIAKTARKRWFLYSIIVILTLLLNLAGPAIPAGIIKSDVVHAQDGGWGLQLGDSDGAPDDPNIPWASLDVGCWSLHAYGHTAEGQIFPWARIDPSGNMTGGCRFLGGDTDTTLFAGSLSGTFNPSSGAISNFHIETTSTYDTSVSTIILDGSGGPLNPPDSSHSHQVSGKYTATYDDTKDTYGGVYDKTETGTFTLKLSIVPIGPSIRIDRAEAARFSALKLTGSGFQKGDNLKIMFNGQEIYQVDVMPDGTIPKDIWIWVPDDAPFGVNKVWAEVKGKDTKSNTLDLDVKALGREQLVSNFDEVTKQYLATIPRNERWYAFTRSGAVRNIVNAGQGVGASAIWLTTTVLTLGFYQAELWPDNEFVCSDYQAKTLVFLDFMRFDPDPARRALLDGLDYGPFNSGLVFSTAEIDIGAHFFVVMWPHAAALDQTLVAAGFPSTWETAGIAFDPWPKQTPEIFEVKSGTGGWAETSIYSSRWKVSSQYLSQHSYPYIRPEPRSFEYNKDLYPITGAKYYDPKVREGKLAADYRSIVGIGNEPPKMLSVHSPVTLEFTDSLGNKAGMKPDGELYADIPGIEMMVVEKPEGGYEWYVALPEGKVEVAVTGTANGSYQLVTKTAAQPIQEYPPVTTSAGVTDHLILDDLPEAKPLQTANGQSLTPTEKNLPWESNAPAAGLPSLGGSTMAVAGVIGGGVCCLLIVGLVLAIGMFRRKPRAAQVASPVRYPPPTPAAISHLPASAQLIVTRGAIHPLINIPFEGLTIGRDNTNTLALTDDFEVSRHHAVIQFGNGMWFITDLNSANGIFVNGVGTRQQALKHGDRILIGQTELMFQIVS